MKKLFSIFFVLALMWSGSVYAATYTYHFSFDEDGTIETWYFFRGAKTGLTAITLTDIIWLPLPNSDKIEMQFSMGYSSSPGQTNYGQISCPPVGTYTIVTSANNMNTTKMWAGGDLSYGQVTSGTYRGYYYNVIADNISQSNDIYSTGTADSWISYDGATPTNFKSGSFTVEKGRHGYPYIYSSSLKDVSNNSLNITINDSRNLNATYTSAEIATDADNKKVAMFAYNGTDNRMNLIFDVASIDANIGIPTGTYIVGTNVFGEIYDTDGYATWNLTSGTITISKSSNKISMSVSSLRGNDNDGTSRTLTISMSNVTPSVSAATSITSTNGTMSVPNSNSWHQIWGFDKDDNSYGMKVSVYKGVVSNGNVAASYSGNYNVSDVAYTHITKPSGDINPNNNYIVSNLYYDKRYKSGKAYIAMKGTDGQFYMATIYSTKWYSSSQMYLEYDKTSSFGPQNFAMLDVDEDDDDPGTYTISGNTGTYQITLARFHGGEGDGLIPSGEYDINPACFTNSLYIGGYDLNSAGTALDMIWGSYVYQNTSNVWFLRSGTVTVTNVNETYYVDVQARNSRIQSGQETYTVQYTLGTAPKTLTFNSDANGSVAASFNATNWGKTITDYAEGTDYPFFTGQTIVLTPTPADGYEFNSWTGGSPIDNGDGTYSITIGASNISLTANFRAAVSNYAVRYLPGTYGTGDAIADDTKEAGVNLTLSSSTYTRAGYTQTGWSINSDGSTNDYTPGDTYTTDEDLDLYPYWEANTNTAYQVKHYQQNIAKNDYVLFETEDLMGTTDASITPTVKSYEGFTAPSATTTTIAADGSTVVEYQYTRNTYTLAWETDGNTLTGTYTSGTVAYGTTLTAPTATREGYTFTGWSPEVPATMPANNVTYVAQWSAITYNITYKDQGNADYSGSNASSLPDSHTYNVATTLEDGEKDGYNFLGWYDNADCTGDPITEIGATSYTDNITLYAKWELATVYYTVTINPTSNGTITVKNGETAINNGDHVDYGTTLTVTATPATGYHFDSWTNDGAESVTVNSDVIIGATFEVNTHTLAWYANGGTLTGGTAAGPTDYGITLTAPTAARDGYTFTGWLPANPTTMPDADVTYIAQWTPDDITLCENCDDDYYNTFKETYKNDVTNKTTRNVTLNRTFMANRWSTLCLPFDLTTGQLSGSALNGIVFEFQRATGNADKGSGVTLYFKKAKEIKAGRGYLVNTSVDVTLSGFEYVTINTDADSENANAESITAANHYEESGSISIVGTLRYIQLPAQNHDYMGLMYDTEAGKTKIYYPGTRTYVPAYRAFFHIDDSSPVQQRVRIVVDGVDMGELEVMDNGELLNAGDDDRAPRKYIKNGVLLIERNGVTYDAQGKRM